MKMKTLGTAWVLCLLAVSGVQAHHSYGRFDRDVEKTVSGVVQEFQWTNPHARLVILAADGRKLYDVVFKTADGGRGGAAGVGGEIKK